MGFFSRGKGKRPFGIGKAAAEEQAAELKKKREKLNIIQRAVLSKDAEVQEEEVLRMKSDIIDEIGSIADSTTSGGIITRMTTAEEEAQQAKKVEETQLILAEMLLKQAGTAPDAINAMTNKQKMQELERLQNTQKKSINDRRAAAMGVKSEIELLKQTEKDYYRAMGFDEATINEITSRRKIIQMDQLIINSSEGELNRMREEYERLKNKLRQETEHIKRAEKDNGFIIDAKTVKSDEIENMRKQVSITLVGVLVQEYEARRIMPPTQLWQVVEGVMKGIFQPNKGQITVPPLGKTLEKVYIGLTTHDVKIPVTTEEMA